MHNSHVMSVMSRFMSGTQHFFTGSCSCTLWFTILISFVNDRENCGKIAFLEKPCIYSVKSVRAGCVTHCIMLIGENLLSVHSLMYRQLCKIPLKCMLDSFDKYKHTCSYYLSCPHFANLPTPAPPIEW